MEHSPAASWTKGSTPAKAFNSPLAPTDGALQTSSLVGKSTPPELVSRKAIDGNSNQEIDLTGAPWAEDPILILRALSTQAALTETTSSPKAGTISPRLPTDSRENSRNTVAKANGFWSLAPISALPSPPPLPLLPSIGAKGQLDTAKKDISGPTPPSFNEQEASAHAPLSPPSPVGSAPARPTSAELTSEFPVCATLAFKATLTPQDSVGDWPLPSALPPTAIAPVAVKRLTSDVIGETSSSFQKLGDTEAPSPIQLEGMNSFESPHGANRAPEATRSSKVDHTPSFPGQVTDNSVVITPVGNITSDQDRPRANSPGPEKTESKPEINPPTQTPPSSRDITVKVNQTDLPNVDIRLSERGGKVLLSVRSESPELTQSLRADLGDLVSRLERRGYHTDTVIPAGSLSNSQHGEFQERESSNRGGNGQNSQPKDQRESRSSHPPMPDISTFSLDEVPHDEHEPN
jgi:hypothetical protein